MANPIPDSIAPRKIASYREEVFHEGGPVASTPLVKGSVVAVIDNPFAGSYVPEIEAYMDTLKPLGLQMAARLIELLGGADAIQGFGKGAIVGGAR